MGSPLHPLSFHCNLSTDELGPFDLQSFYNLDFADCIHMMWFNLFLFPLCSCKMAAGSRGLVRLWVPSSGKTTGDGVSLDQEAHNLWLCPLSQCLLLLKFKV